jgi:FMN-dependent oxidoreductase (nitrilotriacetate monooxygenase family)
MPKSKEIRINAFHMNAPSHSWAGLWRHPRDASLGYNTLDYWVDLARTAERGKLDGIFLADVFGSYDVYGGSAEAALSGAAQAPNADPFTVVPAMAVATKHIGFGVTANLTYEHPYQFGRRLTSLDHLTNGRIGWNIVTGYLDSGARGMGLQAARSHDERYDAGEDFLEALYKLLEGSWEDGAALRDKERGIFTAPDKVHRVRHDGPYYKVDAVHLGEPSPQRTPVLYQAGTSGRGRRFAARHAEAIFLNGPTKKIAADAIRDTRNLAKVAGRDPYDILTILGATVIVAPTRAEARDLQEEYSRYLDVRTQLTLISGWTGIDFSRYDPDQVIEYVESNAMQSLVENYTTRADRPLRVRDLAGFDPVGARTAFIVGSPVDVADELQGWVRDADVDGFNLARVVVPETLNAFVDLVVPELQSRGVFKTEYREGPLREKLFPGNGGRLPDTHPAAGFRHFIHEEEKRRSAG